MVSGCHGFQPVAGVQGIMLGTEDCDLMLSLHILDHLGDCDLAFFQTDETESSDGIDKVKDRV